jgi:hypothetical protein
LQEGLTVTRRPFEVSPADLESDLGAFVDITFADLQSSFLVIPKGDSFVEYPRFRAAYETLKRRTKAFRDFSADVVWDAVEEDSLVFVVVRTILGMTPPELAELGCRRAASHGSGFQTVACIDGRGFGIRRRDMENLLLQLGGKVFTLNTLDALVEHTEIHKFVTKL